MTSTWLLYVICALMLLAAIAAVLPTVLRTKNDVNGEALDREATALATKSAAGRKKPSLMLTDRSGASQRLSTSRF